jgi:hypothetical protein
MESGGLQIWRLEEFRRAGSGKVGRLMKIIRVMEGQKLVAWRPKIWLVFPDPVAEQPRTEKTVGKAGVDEWWRGRLGRCSSIPQYCTGTFLRAEEASKQTELKNLSSVGSPGYEPDIRHPATCTPHQ